MAADIGPHRICRSGRHCLALTGMTPDGRCLPCRRESHRVAQSAYRERGGERTAVERYRGTAKGQLTRIREAANRRGAS